LWRRSPGGTRDDVRRTLMRLDVLGQFDLQDGRCTLSAVEAEQG
jgi:hypothetical protein